MPFDISPLDKICVFCAKRGSGKSELMLYLYKQFKECYDNTFVITPSKFNGFWEDIPEKNVYDEYNQEFMEKLIQTMTRLNNGKKQKDNDFKRVLLILDDCMSDVDGSRNTKKIKHLQILCARGRHLGISLWVSVQYIHQLNRLWRENTDILFLANTTSMSQKILFDEFQLGNIDTKRFKKYLNEAGKDYKFLVIKNYGNSNNESDVYGYIKASIAD